MTEPNPEYPRQHKMSRLQRFMVIGLGASAVGYGGPTLYNEIQDREQTRPKDSQKLLDEEDKLGLDRVPPAFPEVGISWDGDMMVWSGKHAVKVLRPMPVSSVNQLEPHYNDVAAASPKRDISAYLLGLQYLDVDSKDAGKKCFSVESSVRGYPLKGIDVRPETCKAVWDIALRSGSIQIPEDLRQPSPQGPELAPENDGRKA
ncbi:MAG TPA: hypothetical protein VK983_05125 [Candidatus Limnocylindrales bacterium]|nr:hypothetical protein [Candidatus Limnocylindrales bacterium]